MSLLTSWPRRQFVLAVGGICVLAIAAVASFALAPQARRLKATMRAAPVNTVSRTEDLQSQLMARDATMVGLSRSLNGKRDALPPREFEAFVVDQLQANASRHAVSLNGVIPARGERIESFREHRFELSLRGGYAGIAAWLHALRDDLGFVVIKELRMSRANARPEHPDNPLIQAELTLASYQVEGSSP